jgi:hypothetical protein
MTPRTLRIDNGRGTLIVGEHPDSCYICVMAGDAGTSMFLTEAQLIDAIAELRAIRERLRGR